MSACIESCAINLVDGLNGSALAAAGLERDLVFIARPLAIEIYFRRSVSIHSSKSEDKNYCKDALGKHCDRSFLVFRSRTAFPVLIEEARTSAQRQVA